MLLQKYNGKYRYWRIVYYYKEEDDIKAIDFNPITVNKILTETTALIQSNLKYLEQGKIELLNLTTNALVDYNQSKLKQGIIYEIPSGVIFGNSF